MKGRNVAAALVAVLLVAGGAVWLALQGTPPPDETGAAPGDDAPAVKAPAPAPEARKRVRAGRAWVELGVGEVAGTVLEYGTDRPLADLAITLAAGVPGPDRTFSARTDAAGGFRFKDVPNFEDWNLHVDAPAPLADVEQGGVNVVENRSTDLGVVYVTPGFGVPGIVVDDQGVPVEGAEVRALRAPKRSSQADILRLIRELPVETPSVDKAKSAADGKFRLTKTSPGSYDFKVVKSGRQVLVERQVVVTPDAENRELRFVMRKGFALDGRVVRKGPGGVAGITVVAFHQIRGEMDFLVLDRTFGVTDDEGKFHLDGLGGGEYIVAATPDGEPFAIRDRVPIPATTFLELAIEGDAWLEGRVTGKGGAALAGAQVYVADFDSRGKSPMVANARTDAEGRYTIRGLRSGKVQLFLVQAEGYATWPTDLMSMLNGRGSSGLDIVAGRNERDVSLEPGGTIRGVVTSKDDDKPIDGVRVEAGGVLSLFGGSRGATTDAQGKFVIESVPMGTTILFLSKDGWFQPGLSPMAIGAAFQGGAKTQADTGKGYIVSISEPGQTVERTLSLARGSTLAGQVLTPDGAPFAGARVELRLEDDGTGMGQIRALMGGNDPRLTDAEGRFEIAGPPPGTKARAVAKAPGFLEGTSDAVSTGIGQRLEGVVVTLRRGATVEGRVTGPDGVPIDGALVRWIKTEGLQPWELRWRLEQATPVASGADGRFRAENVDTGKIAVQVTHAKFLPVTFQDVAVDEGKSATVDAKLAGGARIEGRVLGPDGKPRSGATVRLRHLKDPGVTDDPFTDDSPDVSSAADGKFAVEALVPGRYEIFAETKGAAPSDKQTVEAGGAALTLRLLPALRIAGTVRVQGTATAGVNVTVNRVVRNESAPGAVDEDGDLVQRTQQITSTETDKDGRFVAEDLPAGTYELEFGSRSWGRADRANVLRKVVADVQAGNEGVLVELEPGASIAGTVTLEDGTPAANGWTYAQQVSPDGKPIANPVAQGDGIDDGAFEIKGLVPGTYDVTVNAGNQGQKRLRIEAPAKDVRVKVGGGGRVRGRVQNDDGTPAIGVWVSTRSDSGDGPGAQTDAEGNYTIAGVDPGRYVVDANAWNAKPVKRGVAEGIDVRAGDTTEVPVITLRPVE